MYYFTLVVLMLGKAGFKNYILYIKGKLSKTKCSIFIAIEFSPLVYGRVTSNWSNSNS